MTDLKEVAIHRLEILTEDFHLSPTILNRFREDGTVYYSYITGFLIPSIDVISYHPEYEELVNAFEDLAECIVYHAIESEYDGHKVLSLLHVRKRNEGEYQWRFDNYLRVFSFMFDTGENGNDMIRVEASDPEGALIAVERSEDYFF